MKNLLIVGLDYKRTDQVEIIKEAKQHFNLFFLSKISRNIESIAIANLGKEIFWTGFYSTSNIIKRIKPFKILFFDLENFNEILLNIEAKKTNIPTYLVDHGVRIFESAMEGERNHYGKKKSSISYSKPSKKAIIKNIFFYLNSYRRLNKEEKKFFKHYKQVRANNSVFKTRLLINDKLRIPKGYISFSKELYKFWQRADHLDEDQEVHFIGFPGYDKYYTEPIDSNSKITDAIFLDQPFHEVGLLGWTKSLKKEFIKDVVSICDKNGVNLHIKIHPISDLSFYKELQLSLGFNLIEEEEFTKNITSFQLILGYGSSLNFPLLALPHTLSISFDFHPIKLTNSLTSHFVNYGVSENVKSMKEFYDLFKMINQKRSEQQKRKEEFIQNWMFKFDGKSAIRLNEVLLHV